MYRNILNLIAGIFQIAYYVSGNTQGPVHFDITNSHDKHMKEALLCSTCTDEETEEHQGTENKTQLIQHLTVAPSNLIAQR